MKIVVSVNVSPNYICFFIVCSLSCIFNRFAACFQGYMNMHRMQEYSKYRAYQTLLKITHNKTIK